MQFVADSALEKAGADSIDIDDANPLVEESIYVVELPLLSVGRSRTAAVDLRLRADELQKTTQQDRVLELLCCSGKDDEEEEETWWKKSVEEVFPPLTWVPKLTKDLVKSDLVAGLTVGVMAIPQSMSYASIAGLEFVYGLYAAAVPALTYAFLGGSGQLAVGPVALVSLLVEEGLRNGLTRNECEDFFEDDDEADPEDTLAAECPNEYARLVHVCMLWVGVIQLGASVVRLGFLVNFLGHPVISGFTSAAAIIIAFSQLKSWLAVSVPKSQYAHDTFGDLLGKVIRGKAKGVPLLLGLASWAVLYAVRRGSQKYPKRLGFLRPLGPLIVCVFTLVLIVATGDGLRDVGVEVIGLIPRGLPKPTFSVVLSRFVTDAGRVLPTALSVSLVGFMESYAIATSLAAKQGQSLPSTRELRAVGISNIAGSFFSGYPVAGSFSRSAVANSTGAKTPLAGFVTGCVLMIALAIMPSFARKLPRFVLASVVIASVVNLVAIEEAKRLWRVRKPDFALWFVAFAGTLFLGVLNGLSIAVVVSLLLVIAESVRPQITVLWKLPGTTVYRNVQQGETNGQFVDGVLVTRVGASMYFANVSYIKDSLLDLAKKYDKAIDRHWTTDSKGERKKRRPQEEKFCSLDGGEGEDGKKKTPPSADDDKSADLTESPASDAESPPSSLRNSSARADSEEDRGVGAIRYIVVEMTPVQSLDSTALHMIEDLVKDCRVRGVHVVFASVGSGAEETMRRAGIQRHVGYEWFHPNVNSAVEFCVRHRAATDALGEGHPHDDEVTSPVEDGDVETNTPSSSSQQQQQQQTGTLNLRSRGVAPPRTAEAADEATTPENPGGVLSSLFRSGRDKAVAEKKKTDESPKKNPKKNAKVLMLASKHRVVERSHDVLPQDNELLAPERRAIDAYTADESDLDQDLDDAPPPPSAKSDKAEDVPRDKYAFLASRRAVIQRSATSSAPSETTTVPLREALAPARVVAVVDPEAPDLMLHLVIDTVDRPGLVRDIGATITQNLAYQIRFSEAAVVGRRSISTWRCEVTRRRGIPEVANAAKEAEATLKKSLNLE